MDASQSPKETDASHATEASQDVAQDTENVAPPDPIIASLREEVEALKAQISSSEKYVALGKMEHRRKILARLGSGGIRPDCADAFAALVAVKAAERKLNLDDISDRELESLGDALKEAARPLAIVHENPPVPGAGGLERHSARLINPFRLL